LDAVRFSTIEQITDTVETLLNFVLDLTDTTPIFENKADNELVESTIEDFLGDINRFKKMIVNSRPVASLDKEDTEVSGSKPKKKPKPSEAFEYEDDEPEFV
jgi:hypothetical protein